MESDWRKRSLVVMALDLWSAGRVACVARVSAGLGSKERLWNGIFGILPAQNCPFLAQAKHRKRLIFARKQIHRKSRSLLHNPTEALEVPRSNPPLCYMMDLCSGWSQIQLSRALWTANWSEMSGVSVQFTYFFTVVLYHFCYYYYYYSSASTTMIKEVIFGDLLLQIIACTRVDPPLLWQKFVTQLPQTRQKSVDWNKGRFPSLCL